ncbi:SseB family protein [Umezawaea beigongshangensis]|uniref:SseB family protein n=1 Tax=Umezawaea beigongshangensis TaxID=2780383 RepID=UPI0018F1A5BE|nr:SseB family protein [Umezawaea beigongshangensis]
MNRENAISAAHDWIRRTHGADAERLRILVDDVVLVRGQWYVPYDAVDDVLVPLPAVEVPDDGGQPRRFVHPGPLSPWSRGVPEFWPAPGPDLAVVDPEWDRETFAHLGVPPAAVLGWLRAEGSDEFRRNSEYLPGPVWLGWPAPQTPADKMLAYHHCGWLGDDPALFAGLLDITVYVLGTREEEGRSWVEAYSSRLRFPPRTWRWRETGVRELLTTMQADQVRINPGHPMEIGLNKEIADFLHRWPEPFPQPAAVVREVPEFDPAWTDAVIAAATALGAQNPPHTSKVVRVRIFERHDEALASGFAIEGRDREALTEAITWQALHRPEPPPPSAQLAWDDQGKPMRQVPTLGRAGEWDYLGTQPHSWTWVVGAYVGFALGESAAGGDGTLTAGLVRLSDDLVRAAADRFDEVPMSLSWIVRPAGWLDALVPAAEPVPEVIAFVAAAVSGDPWMAREGWDDRISPVFDRVFDRGAFSRATHVALAELGVYPHVVALREQREVPLREQLSGLDDPWERVLLIAAKLGHDPAAALAAASSDPLTAALVGALIGARHGVPGLPGLPRDRDLVERAAAEVHRMFDPQYTPAAPPHPGLPPVTEAMRAEAKKFPGGWLWCADPEIDPRYVDGAPTPTLFGAYAVGPDGELTGETWRNDQYRPGPRRLGLPEPETQFEEVLNLVTAGWLPYEALLAPALEAVFWTTSEGDPEILLDAQGNRVLPVYSSFRHLPPDVQPGQVSLRSLLSVLPGVLVLVNAGGAVGADIRGEHLAQVAAGTT